ncbi:Cytochrome P450 [Bacillus mycoides]|uniref:Cytochrome P450 n=1 Tax=Bacillus mycoides TaxID=1405 RepID=A0A1E8BVE2_BACMY|nr:MULTISPECIES: cytochrome P450 [Bacillus cereus group]MBJ8009694.1 cytochrome P450 [Bacillus cereus]MDM5460114.1 cytochrome P450 [Bacillus cereus]OFD37078.1 Cytochrome P450 [Bacillus mycoides]OFD53375.1 Cytochrome P450 [Bacillus mycoides]OFD66110.1 Cytochrome P450 [Bacillus mycoides]
MKLGNGINQIRTLQKSIPGPKSIFGWRMNMIRFYRSPFMYSRWLHDTYGKVVTLGQGKKPSYVFAFGPELNEQILTNPDLFKVSSSLVKIPKDSLLGRMFFNNLIMMTGEKHKQHRRLMQPAFHRKQIVTYCTDMVQLTQRLINNWQEDSVIELNHEMKKLTQRIAVKTLFGLYNEAELDQMGRLIHQMTKSLLFVTLAPINLPGTPYHRALRSAEQLDNHVRAMIAEKRLEINATDVLASLIQARDEDGTQLTDDELVGHTFTLYVAGHETTANALTWSIFLLSQHPDILYNLLEELDGTLGSSDPTLEKLSLLPLLDGVIKETLRLLPPAGVGVRITSDSCKLGGFTIPKDTNVFFNQMVTHRLPELYDEPDCFKPERWNIIKRSLYEYLPFSAGQHMCIGWNFAIQEMKVVLAVLLQRFQFSVVHNAKISPNMMMRPIHGMPMHITSQHSRFQRIPVRGTINQLVNFDNTD